MSDIPDLTDPAGWVAARIARAVAEAPPLPADVHTRARQLIVAARARQDVAEVAAA